MSGHDTNLMRIDPLCPDLSIIRRTSEMIRAGGLVVFPTRALYGIGANALDSAAVDRVFKIKRRPENKPISVLISSRADLDNLVADIPGPAKTLMDRFWPGNLTILFTASTSVPENLTAQTGKIGIRLPAHPVAAALVKAVSTPLTATSANISGHAGCSDISTLPDPICLHVSGILDAGVLSGGSGSAVIDVTTNPPVIVRQGDIPASLLKRASTC
ncbi:MAG: threonylcarbamoyl-AMP synthase [Deltaproteobacteria bacterium]|nr:threonylcarbamoyl-AMP synthase [Deltaproteobacteria bacterium]